MTTSTHTDDPNDHDGAEYLPAHQSALAIVPAADIEDRQSVPARLDQLERSLQNASTSEEMMDVQKLASGVHQTLRSMGAALEQQNRAAEIKIRAERCLGEALARPEKAKGGGDQRSDHRSHDVTGGPPTLGDLGITKTQSSRWQAMWSVPEGDLEKYIAKVKDQREELTSAGVLRIAKRLQIDARPAGESTAKPENGEPAANSKEDGVVAIDDPAAADTATEEQNQAGAPAPEDRREEAPKSQRVSAREARASDKRVADALDRLAALPEQDRAVVLGEAVDRWGPLVEEPQGHDSAGGDHSQQGGMPVGLQIVPDSDPYSGKEPLWVRGGLQSLGFIVSVLPHIPTRTRSLRWFWKLWICSCRRCWRSQSWRKKRKNHQPLAGLLRV